MSADNIIYVKETNKQWHVWHTFVSNNNTRIDKKSEGYKSFKRYKDALNYAHILVREIGLVEYGVEILEKKKRIRRT